MILKYDKMVEITKEQSRKKMALAERTISEMLSCREKITVAKLVRKTGLSRGFFYKNEIIRPQLDQAIYLQRSGIMEQDLFEQEESNGDAIRQLRKQLMKEKAVNAELIEQNDRYIKENEALRQKIERIEKQLRRKEVSYLKKL